MLPLTGSWATWMTQVCRTVETYLKESISLSVCSAHSVLLAADFAAPLVLPGCSSGAGTTPTESLSEEHLATIVSMGFSRDQATKALRATVSPTLKSEMGFYWYHFPLVWSNVLVQIQLLPFFRWWNYACSKLANPHCWWWNRILLEDCIKLSEKCKYLSDF